jgi:hypothetical protein
MRKEPDTEIDLLLTQQEVAARWKCSLRKLQRLRTSDAGPNFVRLGGSIRYLLDDIFAFENSHRVKGTKP